MPIKSILIASVAALAGVTGARAADAVVAAEPEPAEYVRVCDAYGAGFFYIPGSETCLKISGYVRMQVGAENWDNAGDTATYHYGADAGSTWETAVRGRLNIDARSDTELGTLRSFLRLQGDWTAGGDAGAVLDQAYIQLGGLDVGYSESFYDDDHISGIGNYGSHSDSGLSYGYQQRGRIGYRFKGEGGMFAVAGLEFDNTLNYLPDVVGKIGVEQDWGGASLAVAYDETSAAPVVGATGNGEWALKGAVKVNVPSVKGDSVIVMGQYASGPNSYAAKDTAGRPTEWSVLASYNHQWNDRLGTSVGVQYLNGFGANPDNWVTELSAVYTPVTNFEIRGELGYAKATGLDGTLSGYIRFTRFF